MFFVLWNILSFRTLTQMTQCWAKYVFGCSHVCICTAQGSVGLDESRQEKFHIQREVWANYSDGGRRQWSVHMRYKDVANVIMWKKLEIGSSAQISPRINKYMLWEWRWWARWAQWWCLSLEIRGPNETAKLGRSKETLKSCLFREIVASRQVLITQRNWEDCTFFMPE